MDKNHVAQEDAESVVSPMHIEEPKQGELLMFKRVLLKPEKEKQDLEQKKSLFRTMYKLDGKCCKVIVNSESIDNIYSQEMVEKIKLKKLKHHNQ